MARSSAWLLAATLVGSLLLVTPAAPAAEPQLCEGTPSHPGFAYTSENLTVWFHAKKPFVKVFQGNDSDPDNQSVYSYHASDVLERDASNRTLSKMHLERAYPQSSNCTVEEDENFINLTFSVTDDVKPVGPGNKLAKQQGDSSNAQAKGTKAKGGVGTSSTPMTATIDFLYHFNKSAHSAKFDIHVTNWPWIGGTNLAYSFHVDAEGGQVVTAENGVGIMNASGEAQLGYIEWAQSANVTYADSSEREVPVLSNATSDGSHADVTLGFGPSDPSDPAYAPAGYVQLIYDPVVGVGLWVIVNDHLYVVPVPVPSARTVRHLVGL